MALRTAASSVASAMIMPSPLNLVSAKICTVSVTSATEIAVAPGFFKLVRMRFAPANALASAISASGTESPPFIRWPTSFSMLVAHCTAAMISGGRMRPSPSVSIKSAVFGSSSVPRVGTASAIHSF